MRASTLQDFESQNMVLVAQVSCANTLPNCAQNRRRLRRTRPALRLPTASSGPSAYTAPDVHFPAGNLERDLATFNSFGEAMDTSPGVRALRIHKLAIVRTWARGRCMLRLSRPRQQTRCRGSGLAYKGKHRLR